MNTGFKDQSSHRSLFPENIFRHDLHRSAHFKIAFQYWQCDWTCGMTPISFLFLLWWRLERSHGNTPRISTVLLAYRIAALLPMCRAEAQWVVRRNVGAGTNRGGKLQKVSSSLSRNPSALTSGWFGLRPRFLRRDTMHDVAPHRHRRFAETTFAPRQAETSPPARCDLDAYRRSTEREDPSAPSPQRLQPIA